MHEKTTTVRRGDRVYHYRSLVRSVRVDGKPTHEVLARLGRIDHLTPAQKEEMGRFFLRMAGVEEPPAVAKAAPSGAADGLNDPEIGETRGFGDIFAIGEAWKSLQLDALVRSVIGERAFEFDLERAVFAMVANRLSAPKSKYGTVEWLFRDVYLPTGKPLDADHLYETLTWLADVQPELELSIYRMLVGSGRLDATAVFYDTTGVWFEGLGPPELAARGRKKGTHPANRRMILVGLVRSQNGWPIAHRVFPGNTADVSTVRVMLQDLVERFGVRRFIFVGDRGMVSEEVISLLEDDLKVEYVLATKLRGNEEVRDEVLSRPGRYEELEPNLGVKEVWVENRRYVVCRNQIEALNDVRRREEIVGTLREKHLGRPCKATTKRAKKLVTSGSFGRYLVEQDGFLEIDPAKVAKDERYDGKWVIRTNAKLTTEEAARLYKKEVGVERDFRDLKSFIELRPVFHHLDARVRAHVFVCILAKIVARELETRLHRNSYVGSSVQSVLMELARIRVAEIGAGDERRYVRTRLTPPQEMLFRRLEMDPARLPWRLPVYELESPRRTRLDHVDMETARQERLAIRREIWEQLREVDRVSRKAAPKRKPPRKRPPKSAT
jgi:hypothetical protein